MLRNAQCDQIWAHESKRAEEKTEMKSETKRTEMAAIVRHHLIMFDVLSEFCDCSRCNAMQHRKPPDIGIVNRAREKYHKKISWSYLNVLTIFVIKHLTWIRINIRSWMIDWPQADCWLVLYNRLQLTTWEICKHLWPNTIDLSRNDL